MQLGEEGALLGLLDGSKEVGDTYGGLLGSDVLGSRDGEREGKAGPNAFWA